MRRREIRKIYTAGDDCLVRIWNPDGGVDQEPLTASEAQGSVGALDTSVGRVAGTVKVAC